MISQSPNVLDFAVIRVFNGENAWSLLGGVGANDPRLSDPRAPLPHTHLVADVTDFDPSTKEDKANRDTVPGYCPILNDGFIPINRQRFTTVPPTAWDNICTDGREVLVDLGNVLADD